jgi:hypothetical protein
MATDRGMEPAVRSTLDAQLSEEEREHIRSWTEDEWLSVIRLVRPSSDIEKAIAHVNRRRETAAMIVNVVEMLDGARS